MSYEPLTDDEIDSMAKRYELNLPLYGTVVPGALAGGLTGALIGADKPRRIMGAGLFGLIGALGGIGANIYLKDRDNNTHNAKMVMSYKGAVSDTLRDMWEERRKGTFGAPLGMYHNRMPDKEEINAMIPDEITVRRFSLPSGKSNGYKVIPTAGSRSS